MKDSKWDPLRILVYNRHSKAVEEEEIFEKRLTNLFYGTLVGRSFGGFVLIRRPLSKLYGYFQNRRISVRGIDRFVKKCRINNDDFDVPPKGYRCFNDFFTRKIKPGRRPVDPDPRVLISPADSRLIVYPIDGNKVYPIKGVTFTVEELIADRPAAEAYLGGLCLVFRLAPADYHRFCYIDDGEHGPVHPIGGNFHSVNPIALRRNLRIFQKNYREYCILDTKNFGAVIQIEVGALLVGKIHQHLPGGGQFFRGQEKGYFEFGASTIIIVLKPHTVNIDDDIAEYSRKGMEALVQYGSAIGKKPCSF